MRLFVGGLSWATDDEGLRRAFEQFGELVDATVLADRDTGRSRGFGFVTFGDPEGARRALAEMDGQQIDGRTVRVDRAKERSDRGPAGGGGPESRH